jgi:uncharacterized membrane-anchored protein YitT (DUF2179 family)
MNTEKLKTFVWDIMVDFVGGLLIAIGIYNFAANAEFPITGISGLALILYHLFGTPIGVMTMVMNVPIALGCYKILGREFFLRSVRTIVITSVVLDVIAPMLPVYSGDRMLAALCTGVFSGMGYGIIYMNNTSTGGVDFITMSVRAKKPHISLGKIAFVVDIAVVFLGGAVYRNVDGIIYGVLISFLLSMVVDKLMYGIDAGKMTLIVTEHGEEIAEMIDRISGRGATLLKGEGSYSKKEKTVVMCACNNKQMHVIRKMVKQVDPKAFTVIMESNEVVGEGIKTS